MAQVLRGPYHISNSKSLGGVGGRKGLWETGLGLAMLGLSGRSYLQLRLKHKQEFELREYSEPQVLGLGDLNNDPTSSRFKIRRPERKGNVHKGRIQNSKSHKRHMLGVNHSIGNCPEVVLPGDVSSMPE